MSPENLSSVLEDEPSWMDYSTKFRDMKLLVLETGFRYMFDVLEFFSVRFE
jgi:hypothetical protein